MLELAASNWVLRTLILVALFGAVALASYLAVTYSARRIRTTRELISIGTRQNAPAGGSLTHDEKSNVWMNLTKKLEDSGLNLSDVKNIDLHKQLRAAGYQSPSAPRIYTFVRLLLIFVLPGLFLLSALTSSSPPGLMKLYVISAILALLGLYIPNLFVRAKADRRRTAIINAFPDSLDLMLVCVEAGLGLEAAMDRVGREMATSHPLIAELLLQTTLMMRAGASREDALRKLGENAGVDQIRSFTTLLIQSDKLGTSMSTTLRVYSGEMREQRRMRAEERAHRLPVLISIPLVCFMLPTMIGVLALPAITLAMRDMFPVMGGN
ncbi:type II secretion system F family protein [Altererythrobacter sp. SALINAS58]|uniref:type II secretion system F family protein n=1 Tax=Alteripontixanthobacter muriae TaxID=2705546 RepID=UPI0015775BFB|nr:type II secretion system F family protein [Alteripontixanthobacter muriae]NTZ41948.1 type II secretion system F family protein [Alteripontixanthobacter muriae]